LDRAGTFDDVARAEFASSAVAPSKERAVGFNAGGVIGPHHNLRPISQSPDLDRAGTFDDVARAELAIAIVAPSKERAVGFNTSGVSVY
jgi:hypothetical protein